MSFIVPMRNGEATILRCLTSILNQKTNLTFEVIVVNNASTDKSIEAIEHLNVCTIYEALVGRSYARNAGLNISRGKWVSFIDCDVELEDNWLEEIYRKLIANDIFDGGQGKIIPSCHKSSLFEKYRYELIKFQTRGTFCHLETGIFWPSINSAACTYRRTRLIEVGGFDIVLNAYEDIDLCWRLWGSGSTFVSVPTAHANVYWDKGTFLSYLIRYFHMGKGSFILQHLWGKRSVLPKFSSQLLRTEDIFFKLFDVLRVWAFCIGISDSQIFFRNGKNRPRIQSMRDVKFPCQKKYIYEVEDKRYLLLLSPFCRIVWTSEYVLLADLKSGKYLHLNHNCAFFDFVHFAELLWLNKNALIQEGFLDVLICVTRLKR